MPDWLLALISAITPSIICGVFMVHYNRKQNKKDAAVEKRAAERKKESLLALEMNMANAKLSYAVAMAVKRGKPNGEVEEGIAAYEAARKKYLQFLDNIAFDHLL
ncbi:MAG: hypothetical protein J6S14_14360 [Clostridia bacterium]|nr:hypothetical protein [Clostridia bacterium]